ncbi:hypothetical protein [Rhodopila sp.]|jgi:hypothetical protein|uniref:hypothetical protein n=1 Tax=Rhodopila sp. TaxID=2480087 RepID=UPI002CDC1FE1|nr:hypothetical protein [Rhodopila sp.]HVZ06494.1 hypothetical protein [Rhodopila sp.]
MRNDPEPLSSAETRNLQRVAGMMVPASAEYDVPGADDPAIFADIVKSLGRDLPEVRKALAALNASAGGSFADADMAKAEAAAAALREAGGAPRAAIERAILQCYYRDDRVLRSLNIEPRPPFPKGHTLEQGDWSLLDAVRSRPKLWRDAPR